MTDLKSASHFRLDRGATRFAPVSLSSVMIWGLLNLGLLGLGASGLPLWAHHLLPRESIAFFEIVCGQMVLGSLIFPVLARTLWTLAVCLAIMLPLQELGGLLSNLGQLQMIRSSACVAIWIAGLGVCSWRLRSEQSRLWLTMAANVFTSGGAVLDYLRWEAAAAAGRSSWFVPASLLPRLCGVGFSSTMWAEASIPAIFGAIGWILIKNQRHSSTFLHDPF